MSEQSLRLVLVTGTQTSRVRDLVADEAAVNGTRVVWVDSPANTRPVEERANTRPSGSTTGQRPDDAPDVPERRDIRINPQVYGSVSVAVAQHMAFKATDIGVSSATLARQSKLEELRLLLPVTEAWQEVHRRVRATQKLLQELPLDPPESMPDWVERVAVTLDVPLDWPKRLNVVAMVIMMGGSRLTLSHVRQWVPVDDEGQMSREGPQRRLLEWWGKLLLAYGFQGCTTDVVALAMVDALPDYLWQNPVRAQRGLQRMEHDSTWLESAVKEMRQYEGRGLANFRELVIVNDGEADDVAVVRWCRVWHPHVRVVFQLHPSLVDDFSAPFEHEVVADPDRPASVEVTTALARVGWWRDPLTPDVGPSRMQVWMKRRVEELVVMVLVSVALGTAWHACS